MNNCMLPSVYDLGTIVCVIFEFLAHAVKPQDHQRPKILRIDPWVECDLSDELN